MGPFLISDWIFESLREGGWRRSWLMSILGLLQIGGRVRCSETSLQKPLTATGDSAYSFFFLIA